MRTLLIAAMTIVISVTPVAAEHLIAAVSTKGSPHQPYGEEVEAGAAAAAERINAAGGVLGERVRVVPWSENCARERARQVAEDVARVKPAMVVGHVCAGAALAAAPLYAKAGILLITPGMRHPGLAAAAGGSALVLRLGGREDRYARDTVDFIARRYSGADIALVADRTRQARALATALAAELGRRKLALKYDERIESSQRSYEPVAEQIRASGAGVVIMPAQPIELGILVDSLRRSGVTAPVVGSDILAVPALVPTAENEGERLILMLPWSGAEGRETAHSVAATNAAAARDRIAARLRAEAAVEVWAAAAVRAGSAEPGKVAEAARESIAATVAGSIRFDDAGDALVPSYVPHVWREGGWEPLTAPH